MTIHAQIFPQVVLTSKVGQTDSVCDVSWGCISRPVQARLQISVCNSYNWCHPGLPEIWFF